MGKFGRAYFQSTTATLLINLSQCSMTRRIRLCLFLQLTRRCIFSIMCLVNESVIILAFVLEFVFLLCCNL